MTKTFAEAQQEIEAALESVTESLGETLKESDSSAGHCYIMFNGIPHPQPNVSRIKCCCAADKLNATYAWSEDGHEPAPDEYQAPDCTC